MRKRVKCFLVDNLNLSLELSPIKIKPCPRCCSNFGHFHRFLIFSDRINPKLEQCLNVNTVLNRNGRNLQFAWNTHHTPTRPQHPAWYSDSVLRNTHMQMTQTRASIFQPQRVCFVTTRTRVHGTSSSLVRSFSCLQKLGKRKKPSYAQCAAETDIFLRCCQLFEEHKSQCRAAL